jgi:hypothetical protein
VDLVFKDLTDVYFKAASTTMNGVLEDGTVADPDKRAELSLSSEAEEEALAISVT